MEGIMNFGGLPQEYSNEKNAEVVIIPVPYDGTVTWRKGASLGPQAIIEASNFLEFYDMETGTEVYRRGIFTAPPVGDFASPEKLADAMKNIIEDYLKKGKYPVVIGGEHSVSIGAVRAFAGLYPDLTVLQLDAHTDLRPEYNGSAYNHACVMSRIREVSNIVQVGIRSMDIMERSYILPGQIFYAEHIHDHDGWIDEAADKLTGNVYLTIDLDVFDPSLMPSTGTPEPGGLSWYGVLRFLKKVISRVDLRGFDVVELCPDAVNKAPDFLAAKLIYKILSYQYTT
jgi:agmatinase